MLRTTPWRRRPLPGCELEDGVLVFDNQAREQAAGE
jgi:hypothetical protein